MRQLDAAMSPDGVGEVVLRSFAKINLYLEVLGVRADGYHEIRSVLQLVDLADTLKISARERGVDVSCDSEDVPSDSTNLAHRAARAILGHLRDPRGVRVSISKRIPVAAGLGGGSSNAAATLAGINELYGFGLDTSTLMAIGAELGSDVPFFFTEGIAFASGRGELLDPLPPLPRQWLVVATPRVAIPTSWAYAQLSSAERDERRSAQVRHAFAAGDARAALASCFNRMEEAVFRAYPVVEGLKRSLEDLGARPALMSGSGSSVFGIFADETRASTVADALRRAGHFAAACRTRHGRERVP